MDEKKNIVDKIVNSDSPEEIDDLIKLFNLNQTKKEIVRIEKLNNILDNVTDEISGRLSVSPEEFSNLDLLKYNDTIHQNLMKANQIINKTDVSPLIQLNQQNNIINMSEDYLSRESREKILNAVKQVLDYSKDEKVINIEEDDIVYYNNEEESEWK